MFLQIYIYSRIRDTIIRKAHIAMIVTLYYMNLRQFTGATMVLHNRLSINNGKAKRYAISVTDYFVL